MKPLILLLAIQCTPLPAAVPNQTIFHYCAETGVPLYIAHRLLISESDNRNDRNNPNGWGYWQLNPKHRKEFSERYNGSKEYNEFNETESTKIALRYLADLHERTGTWRKALYAYKSGPNVKRISKRIKKSVDRILEGV